MTATVFALQWTPATDAYARPTCAATAGGASQAAFTSLTPATTIATIASNRYAPFAQMRRCNVLDNGVVTTWYGDRCFSDGNVALGETSVSDIGQVMVTYPKFWYCTDHTAGVYRWFMSAMGTETVRNSADDADLVWKVFPAFVRGGDIIGDPTRPGAVTKDRIFLSAYEGYKNPVSNMLESRAGVQPTSLQTIAQFRTAAQLRVAGVKNKWELQDYLATCVEQLSYLLEYGHFNAQSLISAGITTMTDDATHNMSSNTGHTAALGNASGQVLHTFDHVPDAGATTGYAMSYRGIENVYGNIYKFVDGINIKADYDPWIADHDFAANTFAHPYIDTGLTLATGAGYITDIATNATYDFGFLGSAGGGSGTTKLCDMQTATTGDRTVSHGYLWGGSGTPSAYSGMFGLDLHNAYTASARYINARLMYIG